MAGKIAIVGSNMVDLITYTDRMPVPGETIEAPRFEMGCGGKGANQAIAAARLGADVMMVTKVGDDIFADNTIRNFETSGIDTRFVDRVPGTSSGIAPIFVEPSGENSILIIKGANATLSPADVDRAADALRECDLIIMQQEIPLETIYYTIAFGARHGIETLFNPAPADPDLDTRKIEAVTFLVPNQTELATISGRKVDNDKDAEAAARSLIARGIRTVIVTLGSRGALLITSNEPPRRIEPVQVTPVDTTGAGDAFIGSFARYYVESRDLDAALHMAVRYAADSITRSGTQKSYATKREFEAFCKNHG
ncbi:MAG: ribokinase [Thalassospira sp.]|uniref:ribokinase n=1 Tax=Thalassospira sp. GB04J01 TaxID=1485225 RepID=UPI000C10052A|nr:ribokinase [Thalassospira sp. GB04J01]MBV16268.1 ribokinase [Thalassospira sp.]|tara:strand:+ start:20805 stop:21734 length:930 start_codon:yes stop_codon:yes gene_type:complete